MCVRMCVCEEGEHIFLYTMCFNLYSFSENARNGKNFEGTSKLGVTVEPETTFADVFSMNI